MNEICNKYFKSNYTIQNDHTIYGYVSIKNIEKLILDVIEIDDDMDELYDFTNKGVPVYIDREIKNGKVYAVLKYQINNKKPFYKERLFSTTNDLKIIIQFVTS